MMTAAHPAELRDDELHHIASAIIAGTGRASASSAASTP